jgi:hypothetical protein
MESTTEVVFHKSRRSGGANCVEVGFGHAPGDPGIWAFVRNSRNPEWVVLVPFSRWLQLVATGRVVLAEWFPDARYGGFAATFTEAEEDAFAQGICDGDPNLTGAAVAAAT